MHIKHFSLQNFSIERPKNYLKLDYFKRWMDLFTVKIVTDSKENSQNDY